MSRPFRFALIVLFAIFVTFTLFLSLPKIRAIPSYGRAVEAVAGWILERPRESVETASRLQLEWRDEVVHQVDPRFLSFAVDSALLVGGRWWSADARIETGHGPMLPAPFRFDQPRLVELASALTPAYLRIGGTAADQIYYDLSGTSQNGVALPAGYEYALTRELWEALQGFVHAIDVDLLFTLNAGPGPRERGAWQSDNAGRLLKYARDRQQAVAAWELGNEPNLSWVSHGPTNWVRGGQLARDLRRLRELVGSLDRDAMVVAPATAYWPLLGELGWPIFDVTEEVLRAGGREIDAISWHYYPQQSRRCPEAVRRARPFALLDPAWLDDIHRWAREVESLRDQHAPGKPVWAGEIGHAQCGGEPGISDVYMSTLWWLDVLGGMARRGQQVVIRQDLVGSNYGLLDQDTLEPRPDYWASVLWQRLMSDRVLAVDFVEPAPFLRAYAHCTPAGDAPAGSVTILLINIHTEITTRVELPQARWETARSYRLSAVDPLAAEIRLNGRDLRYEPGAGVPLLEGEDHHDRFLTVPPLTSQFAVIAGVSQECRAE